MAFTAGLRWRLNTGRLCRRHELTKSPFLTLLSSAPQDIRYPPWESLRARVIRELAAETVEKRDWSNGVAIVITQRKMPCLCSVIVGWALSYAITLVTSAEVLGQSYQVKGTLVARTGPGESYPIAVELPDATQVTKVTEDPSGWTAVRIADGQVVWVASDSFHTNAALVTVVLPVEASEKVAAIDTGTPQKAISPAAYVATMTAPAQGGQANAGVSPSRTAADGWRPAPPKSGNASRKAFGPSVEGGRPSLAAVEGGTLQSTDVSLDQFLDEVDQEFSAMLAKHPALWQVKPLQDKLAFLAGKPLTGAQIERLESLARKLTTAGQIADMWRRSHSPSQFFPTSPVLTRPAPWPQPDTFLGQSGNTVHGNLAPAIEGFAAISTVVPPPATKLPVESYPPGRPVPSAIIAVAPPPAQVLPQPAASGQTDTPIVAPVSFQVTSVLPTAESLGAPSEDRLQGVPAQNAVGQAPSTSLREEIAREINDLRRERFDAVGRLVKAQVRRPNDPPYVVVNESGAIVCYVKPATGTLLRTFVGHWVGVTGKRGRLPDGRGPLIVADSLKLLDPPTGGH